MSIDNKRGLKRYYLDFKMEMVNLQKGINCNILGKEQKHTRQDDSCLLETSEFFLRFYDIISFEHIFV